jgi:hypothetical protein
MVERSDLMDSIVIDVIFDPHRLDQVTLRAPNGRQYDLRCYIEEMPEILKKKFPELTEV